MQYTMWVEPEDADALAESVVLDCRFSLADPAAGRAAYLAGHVPGAHYLALDADLSGPLGVHGGRHPLPEPGVFARTLSDIGIDAQTPVVAYDDSGFAYAARLWWMMRGLGYRPPKLLAGGYRAWLAAGGEPEIGLTEPVAVPPEPVGDYLGVCDITGLRQAMARGAVVIDSRESRRFLGLEEPIDPVAGHIPGAVNKPWQAVTDDCGFPVGESVLRSRWRDVEADEVVVYCGSGVTACVNLFALALLGRPDATLYAGSWSDWCSWL